MTAPQIPTPNVSINPQFVPNTQPGGLEVLLRALERRRELDLEKQKLQREQEQFELNKRLMGSQIEGADLANLQRKRQIADQELNLKAKDQALQLYTGNLPRAGDMKAWGEVMAGVSDPRVLGHLMENIKEFMTISALRTNHQLVNTESGDIVGVDPETLETKPTGLRAPPDAGTRRIPVVTEREKASAAVSTIRANTIINRLESTDPTVGQRVAAKVAARKSIIGGLLRRLVGTSQEDANLLAEQQIEQSMTPEELEYYVAGKQLLSGILPGLSGKQVTAREYVMHAPAYLSMGSTSPQVVASRRKSRTTRIRGFIAEAGEAMDERLPELQDVGDLSEYGLGTLTPPSVDGTVTPQRPARKRRPENPY